MGLFFSLIWDRPCQPLNLKVCSLYCTASGEVRPWSPSSLFPDSPKLTLSAFPIVWLCHRHTKDNKNKALPAFDKDAHRTNLAHVRVRKVGGRWSLNPFPLVSSPHFSCSYWKERFHILKLLGRTSLILFPLGESPGPQAFTEMGMYPDDTVQGSSPHPIFICY